MTSISQKIKQDFTPSKICIFLLFMKILNYIDPYFSLPTIPIEKGPHIDKNK